MLLRYAVVGRSIFYPSAGAANAAPENVKGIINARNEMVHFPLIILFNRVQGIAG